MNSSRGTAIDRVLNFYRTASPDTVRVTHQLAVEVIAARKIPLGPIVKQRKSRTPKPSTAPAPKDGGAS